MLVPDLVKEVDEGATFGAFYFAVASMVMYLQYVSAETSYPLDRFKS